MANLGSRQKGIFEGGLSAGSGFVGPSLGLFFDMLEKVGRMEQNYNTSRGYLQS